ncbi:MAG: hypothetical protein M0Z89_07450 [Nitrospiraceae bacterium]|nr:hypothetical protein [Nitrospiraceae bacterium]
MKTIGLKVEGLCCCADCAANVEKALKNTIGVEDYLMPPVAQIFTILHNFFAVPSHLSGIVRTYNEPEGR